MLIDRESPGSNRPSMVLWLARVSSDCLDLEALAGNCGLSG